MPEGEEDDEFDGSDFEQGLIPGDVFTDLEVKLDDTVHGDADSAGFEDEGPDVGEGGVEGFETVSAEGLGDDGDNSHRDADETVLEDAHPNDLEMLADCARRGRVCHTLKYVKPLRGVRQMPRSPPQHFLNQGTGQIQFLGVMVLKYSFWAWRSGAR